MNIEIEYAAQLKKAAGVATDTVSLDDGSTLQQAVRDSAGRLGDNLGRLLFRDDGQLNPSILVFLADEQIHWSQDPPLKDGDVITLLSPISGG